MKQITRFVLCATLAVIVVAPVGAATVIGQLGSAATMDGTPVPAGTTILSPAVVESGDGVVIVHLTNGRLLALDSQSEVRFEALEKGSLQVATEAGYLSLRDADGGLVTVGASSIVSLGSQGLIQQQATKLGTAAGVSREASRRRVPEPRYHDGRRDCREDKVGCISPH